MSLQPSLRVPNLHGAQQRITRPQHAWDPLPNEPLRLISRHPALPERELHPKVLFCRGWRTLQLHAPRAELAAYFGGEAQEAAWRAQEGGGKGQAVLV